MMVNPSVPARTVAEFIAHAKANLGKINMASSGIGSLSHLTGELFKLITGRKYGARAVFNTISSSIAFIRTGRLRALAVTTATRSETLPDIPTVGDFLPSYEASDWYGVGVPRNTPRRDRREAQHSARPSLIPR
jgi:tripartite-type tricarboxylate transporter receptor subunit TctC